MKYKVDKKYVLKRIVLWSLVALSLESIMVWQLSRRNEIRIEQYLQQQATSLEKHYKSVLNTFKITAKLIYEERINTPEIKSKLDTAYSIPSQQKQIRQEIQKQLSPTYQRMQNAHYDQLHFHLPNNESFLRFHHPEKYGDQLEKVRETVVIANRDQKIISGFEAGEIYNGFRCIFPLSHQNKHIGTVETSMSFSSIGEQLCQDEEIEYLFILKGDIINRKGFKNGKQIYKQCFLNKAYKLEHISFKEQNCQFGYLDQIEKIADNGLTESIKNQMEKKVTFSKYVFSEDTCFVLAFCPIYNFKKEQVGYFFSIEKNEILPHMLNSLRIQISISVVVLFLIIAVLAYTFITKQIIEKQGKELIELNKTKTHFFSIIAHDLRSPFNAILGFGDLVQEAIDNQLEEQSKSYIRQLNEASEKAFVLLENLLQWSRSQAGRMSLKPMDFDLHDLVKETFSLNALRAQEKQIELNNDVSTNNIVHADFNTISTVSRNLISNALKFTEGGGKITATARKNDTEIILSIKDTGIGINNEVLKDLFEFKPDKGKRGTHEESGTGLGLVISKDFIERNGGKLWVESKVGKGSTFSFSLPIVKEA